MDMRILAAKDMQSSPLMAAGNRGHDGEGILSSGRKK